jgi:hypothetical protein
MICCMNSWDIDFYAIGQSWENCIYFSCSMSTPHVSAIFCSSFSFIDLWLFMVYRRFVFNPTNQEKKLLFEWHWFQCYAKSHRKSASLLDVLVFIAILYSHSWGIADNLATLGTVNVLVVHMWRHVSKITK